MEPRRRMIQAAFAVAVGGFGPMLAQVLTGFEFHAWAIGVPAAVGLAAGLPAALDASRAGDTAAGAFAWLAVLASGGWALAVLLALVLF